VDPVDPPVFAGRDPEWREAWEGRLDDESRRRVVFALKEGSRLEDPTLEPFVYGLIARRRRQLRWRIAAAAPMLALVVAWTIATTVVRPSLWGWFYVTLLIVFLTVVPFALLRERRRLERAELAQTSSRG